MYKRQIRFLLQDFGFGRRYSRHLAAFINRPPTTNTCCKAYQGIYLDLTDIQSNFGGLATTEEIREALKDFKKSGKFIYSYANMQDAITSIYTIFPLKCRSNNSNELG